MRLRASQCAEDNTIIGAGAGAISGAVLTGVIVLEKVGGAQSVVS